MTPTPANMPDRAGQHARTHNFGLFHEISDQNPNHNAKTERARRDNIIHHTHPSFKGFRLSLPPEFMPDTARFKFQVAKIGVMFGL